MKKIVFLLLIFQSLYIFSQEEKITIAIKINGYMDLQDAKIQITNLSTKTIYEPNSYGRIQIDVQEKDKLEITGSNIEKQIISTLKIAIW